MRRKLSLIDPEDLHALAALNNEYTAFDKKYSKAVFMS